ncbi:hypothetical protein KIW84_074944 [Lathyrus oleraceus]|uniref:CAAX prenyl protease 1 N-terminal domain-containing protein n=1 Tax=Pisum sativum TaxID=3888 RepID=A0A9D4VTN6_PEA|nr:hypothetical protein KIW84_074944 [Pisum sativum]
MTGKANLHLLVYPPSLACSLPSQNGKLVVIVTFHVLQNSVVVVVLRSTLVAAVFRKMQKLSKERLQRTDKRISLTIEIVAAIIVIVQKGGPYLAIYLWAFMFGLSLVMLTILIAPLFNKFTPLPDGPLREKIEKLASSLKFPLKKLFVADVSTRSSHSNALRMDSSRTRGLCFMAHQFNSAKTMRKLLLLLPMSLDTGSLTIPCSPSLPCRFLHSCNLEDTQ